MSEIEQALKLKPLAGEIDGKSLLRKAQIWLEMADFIKAETDSRVLYDMLVSENETVKVIDVDDLSDFKIQVHSLMIRIKNESR